MALLFCFTPSYGFAPRDRSQRDFIVSCFSPSFRIGFVGGSQRDYEALKKKVFA